MEGSQIALDNIPFIVEEGFSYSLTNVYDRPQRQGEPGPSDHPYNVTHTQRTWISGQLVRDWLPSDIGNYWDGDAWTQTRAAMGHGLKVVKLDLPHGNPGGMVCPHDRLGDAFYFTLGNLNGLILEYRALEPTLLRNPNGAGDLHFLGTASNRGVSFRVADNEEGGTSTQLYIPTTAGYTRMDQDYLVHHAPQETEFATVGFAVHEGKIWRLTTAGQVYSALRHDDAWTYVATIPDGSEPRNLYETYDDDGNRVIGVSTSGGLMLLDADNGVLFKTDLWYPEHAYQGFGVAQWRADDYISVGLGINRKAGGLITQEGMDNRDGLPANLAGGFLVDLFPSYNWLVGAVAGRLQGSSPVVSPTEEVFGMSTGMPYPIVSKGSQANILGINRLGAIFIRNGFGWAKIFQWNRPPTRVVVSMIRNSSLEERQQHMFWGDVDGGAWMCEVPSDFYNPLESPSLPLSRTSTLEESRNDWQAPDTPKVAKQINVKVNRLYDTILPTGPYFNEIQVVCNWLDLDGLPHTSEDPDVLSGPGPYAFSDGINPLGYLTLSATDPTGNSRRSAPVGWERYKNTGALLATGLPHEAIWFTYRFIGDARSDFTGGVIQWRTIIARKWMRPNRVWTFKIYNAVPNAGEPEVTLQEALDNICLKVGGVPMVIGDRQYIVDVTRLDGSGEAGGSPRNYRTISCLEFTDITYEHSFG